MGPELRQHLKLTQQLIMTPQLQQAIRLLQLSRLELLETIRLELVENPALEEVQELGTDEVPSEEIVDNTESPNREVTIEEKIPEEVDWSNYIEEYNTPGKVTFESEEKDSPQYDAFIAKKESLSEHLNWQLLLAPITDEEKYLGAMMIGNVNKDGFLDISVEEIAEASGSTPERVEAVLSLLQTFDPIGVCARDLKETLLIQAQHFGYDNPIIEAIIGNHLNHLENKNYKAIAKSLKIDIEQVINAVNVIKNLEPRPGRRFSEDEPHYISPDIFVYKAENDFIIVLNDEGMPKLRINPYYQDVVSKDGKLSENAKEYMTEKIRSASWLIKSIHQRQKTIYKVMQSILKFQREFFEKGIEYLKPLVLRDVAEDIGMHESTISRVTTNKYAYTPQGIFELKYFFNSSIQRTEGEAVASASVVEKIKHLIEKEDPKNPYSDDKIAQILKASDIHIARRTVAKYREILKILPSSKRRQL